MIHKNPRVLCPCYVYLIILTSMSFINYPKFYTYAIVNIMYHVNFIFITSLQLATFDYFSHFLVI